MWTLIPSFPRSLWSVVDLRSSHIKFIDPICWLQQYRISQGKVYNNVIPSLTITSAIRDTRERREELRTLHINRVTIYYPCVGGSEGKTQQRGWWETITLSSRIHDLYCSQQTYKHMACEPEYMIASNPGLVKGTYRNNNCSVNLDLLSHGAFWSKLRTYSFPTIAAIIEEFLSISYIFQDLTYWFGPRSLVMRKLTFHKISASEFLVARPAPLLTRFAIWVAITVY